MSTRFPHKRKNNGDAFGTIIAGLLTPNHTMELEISPRCAVASSSCLSAAQSLLRSASGEDAVPICLRRVYLR